MQQPSDNALQAAACTHLWDSSGGYCGRSAAKTKWSVAGDTVMCNGTDPIAHTIAGATILHTSGGGGRAQLSFGKSPPACHLVRTNPSYQLPNTSAATLAKHLQLLMLTAAHAMVLYVFLYKPFTWSDGSVARFMF